MTDFFFATFFGAAFFLTTRLIGVFFAATLFIGVFFPTFRAAAWFDVLSPPELGPPSPGPLIAKGFASPSPGPLIANGFAAPSPGPLMAMSFSSQFVVSPDCQKGFATAGKITRFGPQNDNYWRSGTSLGGCAPWGTFQSAELCASSLAQRVWSVLEMSARPLLAFASIPASAHFGPAQHCAGSRARESTGQRIIEDSATSGPPV